MRIRSGLILGLVALGLAGASVWAHPGGTDGRGGHTCRTNCPSWGLSYGQYHFHGGSSIGGGSGSGTSSSGSTSSGSASGSGSTSPATQPALRFERAPRAGEEYLVRAGDTLLAIATRFGLTVAAIQALNPTITDPSQIFVGQRVLLREAARAPAGTSTSGSGGSAAQASPAAASVEDEDEPPPPAAAPTSDEPAGSPNRPDPAALDDPRPEPTPRGSQDDDDGVDGVATTIGVVVLIGVVLAAGVGLWRRLGSPS